MSNSDRFIGVHEIDLYSTSLAPLLDDCPAAEAELIERIAQLYYATLPFDGDHPSGQKPAWVDKGNSDMQELARRKARDLLHAHPPVAAPVAAGSDEVEPGELTESITKTLANLGCDWRSGQPFFMDPDVKVMAILRKALASITADKAAIARLTAELDVALQLWETHAAAAREAEARAEASESRCAALMAALKPFAGPVNDERYWKDDTLVYSEWPGVTFGDIRRARAALEAQEAPDKQA